MSEIIDIGLSQEFLFFVMVGLVAQFIVGTLGMAYGISANTLLISIGISPVQASASIHIAEVATSGISGISHYGFGNVDMELVKKLIIPGMLGAIAGTLLLVWLPVQYLKVGVGLYSANFNHRSMLKDDEVNLVVIDPELAFTLVSHFDQDLEHCEKIEKERWEDRNIMRKAAESFTGIFKHEI